MAQERSDLTNPRTADGEGRAPVDLRATNTAGAGEALKRKPVEYMANDAGADAEDLPEDARRLKGEIENTRGQMGETIDAIQDRLSFSNLSEQVSDHVHNAVETAKDAVYDATIGKAAEIMKNVGNEIADNSIVKMAKHNPLPFALIGLGAGLIVYKAYSGTLTPGKRTSEVGRSPEQPFRSGSSTSDGIVDRASTVAGAAVDKVTGALDTAYTGAGEMVQRASSKANDIKGAAWQQYDTHLQRNPLILGAAALAVGAAVGMAIPATNYEVQLMGETRENLMTMAHDTATELLDKAKRATGVAGSMTPQKGLRTEH